MKYNVRCLKIVTLAIIVLFLSSCAAPVAKKQNNLNKNTNVHKKIKHKKIKITIKAAKTKSYGFVHIPVISTLTVYQLNKPVVINKLTLPINHYIKKSTHHLIGGERNNIIITYPRYTKAILLLLNTKSLTTHKEAAQFIITKNSTPTAHNQSPVFKKIK